MPAELLPKILILAGTATFCPESLTFPLDTLLPAMPCKWNTSTFCSKSLTGPGFISLTLKVLPSQTPVKRVSVFGLFFMLGMPSILVPPI